MRPPPAAVGVADEPMRPNRVQFANFAAYRALMSLVNLLNLPLPQGTFFPPRGPQLTILDRDVERLRMLKRALDSDDPAAVRGYLVAPKALFFEVEVLLHQFPDLPRNPEFSADLERLGAALAGVDSLADAAEVRDLAYKLSIMLPYYEIEEAMRERNRVAHAWLSGRDGTRT